MGPDRSHTESHEKLRRYLRYHRQRTLTNLAIFALIILALVGLTVSIVQHDRRALVISATCLALLLALGRHVSRDT
jgi:sulfite exporter TauE/SafE